MSVGAADIHKAVRAGWTAGSLDADFTALWPTAVDADEFEVLNDKEASPNQPWPYCVFEQEALSVISRMSGSSSINRQIRDVPWSFHVHAKPIDGDSRTGKEIAADLVEAIMKVFGGHPSVSPSDLLLDNGNFLLAQYQDDIVVRTGEDEWQWNVNYIFRVDVPVAV